MRAIELTSEQIESWVARHFTYKRRKNGDELLIVNPFYPDDDKYKFNISTVSKQSKNSKYANNWVHDWRPSAQQYNSSFIKFVQRYKGLTFREAIKDICGDGIDLKQILRSARKGEEKPQKAVDRIALPPTATPIFGSNNIWKGNLARKKAVDYLYSRGITDADIISFRIHFTPTMVIFPYLEYDEVVYWQGRTASNVVKTFEFPDEHSSKSGKSQFVYGFDNAETGSPIFIAEAIFCALTIGPGGLATGGATMSDSQVRKLRALKPAYIVLAPDNDREGRASIHRNWKLLNPYFKIKFLLPPKGFKDWNEFVKKAADKQAATLEIRKYLNKNPADLSLKEAIKFRIDRGQ